MDKLEAKKRINYFKEQWKEKYKYLDSNVKELAVQIDSFTGDGSDYSELSKIREQFKQSKEELPSKFMKKYYEKLVQFFVPKEYENDFYAIIDELNKYPYTRGYERRTIRSKEYAPCFYMVLDLLNSYKLLTLYNCSIYDYLLENMSQDLIELKHDYWLSCIINHFDLMLTARINAQDEKLITIINEMILGDNNTAILSTDVIRAIIKSNNEQLHNLLGDLLLAARLQEGIRQAICENADCGTISAFLKLFQVVYDNHLIRFSAVKRAVATWTGLCDIDHVDRISEKVLESIHEAVTQYPQKALEFTKTNDSILIMCGLWALGFYNADDALKVMDGYVKEGTRNQILTMGYYNLMLQYHQYSYLAAFYVMRKYPDDYEYMAMFLPSFLGNVMEMATNALDVQYKTLADRKVNYKPIELKYLFADRDDAYMFYELMKKACENLPNKKLEYNPIVFPWYSVTLTKSDLITRMCVIAYALQDDSIIDDAIKYIPMVETSGYSSNRCTLLELLAHDCRTEFQRKVLIEAVADKEKATRSRAFDMIKKLTLTKDEYVILEGYLKFKGADIRTQIITLLKQQSDADLLDCIQRLLTQDKSELRMGGLSLLQEVKKNQAFLSRSNNQAVFTQIVDGLTTMSDSTDSEAIIIKDLSGKGEATKVLEEKGYGLYQPEEVFAFPQREKHYERLKSYFSISANQLDVAFAQLQQFIESHGMLEYKDHWGEEQLLGNTFTIISDDENLPIQDQFPFKELWMEFYETYLKNPVLVTHMRLALLRLEESEIENRAVYEKHLSSLMGTTLSTYQPKLKKSDFMYRLSLGSVTRIILNIWPDVKFQEVATETVNYVIYELKEKDLWYPIIKQPNRYYDNSMQEVTLLRCDRMNAICEAFSWKTAEEFTTRFMLLHDLDVHINRKPHEKHLNISYSHYDNNNFLTIFDYIYAYSLNLIPEREVYRVSFELYPIEYVVESLSLFLSEKLSYYERKRVELFMGGKLEKESEFYQRAVEVYENIVDKILNVELSRGDLPTIFSNACIKMKYFSGMERMVQILVAMGKEKLDRKSYYYDSNGTSKQAVLSHLLGVSYPKENEDANQLESLLKKNKITKARLYETMMYAPQWIDVIQQYLKEELKCGCYYFMAHMNEFFDEKKKAMIAKYTPLTFEELRDGAFDSDWFHQAYQAMGQQEFDYLYDAAKYISDGSKHTRARKYADAALGRVKLDEIKAEVVEKRNKDLLMSYGIVPLQGDEDILHRYEYIQQFLKESKQFGAQRKASEGIACDMALKNLATNAGFADVTRLVLSMETKMVESYREVFEPHAIDDTVVYLSVDANGTCSLNCKKQEKVLKSIPANLKKNEYVLHLQDVKKKFKEQYSRTLKMLGQAMEDSERYSFKELNALAGNPIIAPIITNLVFIMDQGDTAKIGLLCKEGLVTCAGEVLPVSDKEFLRVAHPYDLYHAQCWTEYQQYFFDEMKAGNRPKQPFKQVFRELYVKLDEERDCLDSRMFAGNQIQPQKTKACLKNRRWIADYLEGLQKIYYKSDIIANMYAQADWFSPSEIEAPALEWVQFSNRKTFKPIRIKDVPDIVYSEVMRDVDLAISVAHVGGVDPETSHSTMEMRKVIVQFNLPLFKLTNVTFEGHHAIIEGKLAKYSIHLGSGVIHNLSGHQINVLPVHSQSRGKLFLPFVDEDPKTAEIMSKIVLFAQDDKMKDPYILDQIKH